MVSLAPVKRGIARLLSRPTLGKLIGWWYQDRIPHMGCTILTASPVIAPSTKAQIRLRLYERSELRLMFRHLSPDSDVIELGSSIGVLASHIARRLKPGHKLVCVEANPFAMPALRENLDFNAPRAQVTILHAMVGRNSGTFVPGSTTLSGSVEPVETGGEISRVTLDELRARYDFRSYSLVCDIEGDEAALIFDETLEGCNKLVIELHPSYYRGHLLSVDQLSDALVKNQAMRLIDAKGAVRVYER